ncbi:MAG: DUF5685 family protein [Bacillota bacterium]|nr:DUF5685 family protein [Bacillota bacterium]
MFGYVRPDKPELRMRSFSHYRSVYCGLCMELKRGYGQFSRLVTGYDMTFFALLLEAFAEEDPISEPGVCILNPIRKKAIGRSSAVLEETAVLSVLFAAAKLDDNLRDREDLWRSRFALVFGRRAIRRARRRAPQLDSALREALGGMALLEGQAKPGDQTANQAAARFGAVLALCLRHGLGSAAPAVLDAPWLGGLERFMELLGAWVYLIDALDDRADDLAAGRYNALDHLESEGLHAPPERGRFPALFQEYCGFGAERWPRRDAAAVAGYLTLAALETEMDRLLAPLPIRRHGELLANTVQLGLASVRERVMAGQPLERL